MTFFNIAYHIMALLRETVPACQVKWDLSLGHLARYRSRFENKKDKPEVWISNAHSWYTTVSDHRPGAGCIYHHQATIASTWLEQLSLLKKSVVCSQYCRHGQSKIAHLIMQVHKVYESHKSSFKMAFLQAHRDLFPGSDYSTKTDLSPMRELLNDFIISKGTYFNRIGVFVAMTNITTVIRCKVLDASTLKLTSQLKQNSAWEASANLEGCFELVEMDGSSPSQRLI